MTNEKTPEVFADELSGLMLGYPVSKLSFGSSKQIGDNGEVKSSIAITLTIPTQSLLNACRLVLDNAQKNKELLTSATSDSETKLLATLDAESTKTATVSKPNQKTSTRATKKP